MTRSRFLLLAACALLLSVGITYLSYRVLQDRMRPADDVIDIVVAASDLGVGARLTAQDLRVSRWPASAQLAGSIPGEDLADLVGRGTLYPISTNEPILQNKLAPEGAGAGLAPIIPEGMRAYTIPVNQVVGVAGFILPGTRVDVILSGKPVSGTFELSKIVLENVQVLSAGQNLERDATGQPQNVGVVTLLVTPEDSQKLALAAGAGRLQLTLRNPLDLDTPDPVATPQTILYNQRNGASLTSVPQAAPSAERRAAAPAPRPAPARVAPPPPPAPVRREVQVKLIQGTKSETMSFDVDEGGENGEN